MEILSIVRRYMKENKLGRAEIWDNVSLEEEMKDVSERGEEKEMK